MYTLHFDRELDDITTINIWWDIYIAFDSLQEAGRETGDYVSWSAK